MATYLYQIVAADADAPPETFEVRQSMLDAPLTSHPDTGQPIRRVLTGGFGLMKMRASGTTVPTRADGHSGQCCPGCHD